MNEPRIKDIPSISKGLEDLKNMKAMKGALPFARPVLKFLGVDVTKIDEAFADLDKLQELANDLSSIPDRFNDIFASRGWIIYAMMNLDVAKAATAKAEAGDIDGAEQELIAYYSGEIVEFHLRTMRNVQAFQQRMRLAEKALIDYKEERYHASVPVVLALLDGMVNEIHEQKLGFFNKDTNLEAWDSIAAHSTGLNVLTRIFQRSRRKTVTEQISIPYRHGIMHGMDLGYDNKAVAAKCWAALFAAREWALKAERRELGQPPAETPFSWRDLFRKLKENQRQKELLENWQPRSIQLGISMPSSGAPEEYAEESPERRLAEFLNYWMRRNYGYMATCIPNNTQISRNALPGVVREWFDRKLLMSFEFHEIKDTAAAVTEIETRLSIKQDGIDTERTFTFRLINQDQSGHSVIHGEPGGQWLIYNWRTM